MNLRLLYIFLALFVFEFIQAQDGPVLTFNVPTQNTLVFNRHLINPAFSFVKETDTYLTLYHRNQWIEFNDSPELYMISYAGKVGERSGAGIGLYQQNLGIITSFGGVANYAYSIKLKEKISLALGFNLAYYATGVNSNRAVSSEPDPAIMELANNSVLTLKPGINVTWGSFDVGVYAENLVDYDFKSSSMIEEYSNKTFSGHVMYHHYLTNQKGIFDDGFFRIMMRGRINEIEDFKIGGSFLVNFPYLGWVQTGIDDYYGVSIGLGGHLTNRLSLGYTYERVIGEGTINFGPTHEITLAFRFPYKKDNPSTSIFDNTKNNTETVTNEMNEELIAAEVIEDEEEWVEEETVYAPENQNKSTLANEKTVDLSRKAEIEKLRMTLNETHLKLLDMIVKEDSISKMKEEEFDNRTNNLMAYIERLERTASDKKTTDFDEIIEKTVVTETTTTITKNGKSAGTTDTKKDISTIQAAMKSSTEKEDLKQTTAKTAPANEAKKDLTSKLDALKPASKKADLKTPKFEIKDEEIKEYYSKLTTKQRATAKRNYLEVENQAPGFYIIANVFSEPALAKNFINQLKKQGVQANYFVNPKNNLRYVYLRKHSTWSDALISYYTNVDNTYFDTIWIMNINIK
jgi:type IX secretion system PorP/SprF family membrane protein